MNITKIFAAVIIATSLSMTAAYASGDGDHKHAGDMAEKHDHKAMKAEMETIINTEDTAKRKELFEAHKVKMEDMMKKCHPEKTDTPAETTDAPAPAN